MSSVEIRDMFKRVCNIASADPTCFFIRALVTGPSNEVSEWARFEASVDLGVEDFTNVVFDFIIADYRRRRRLDSIRDLVWRNGLKLRYVENRVNRLHA